MARQSVKRRHQGFISIEMIATLAVVVVLIGIGGQWLRADNARRISAAAAGHAKTVEDATAKWLKDNYATIAAAAAPTSTYAMATIASYLPPGFVTTNPYGQSYSIRVYKPASNQLQVLVVTTGGETIPEIDGVNTAQLIGAEGGFISTAATGTVRGAFGGWNSAFTNFGATPGGGKLAVALFYMDGAQTSDFLYRSAVPGHPEYNQMNTAIDMHGNDLNNVYDVKATRVQVGTSGSTFTYAGTSSVIRQPGNLLVQKTSGGYADVQAASMFASGTVTASATVQGDQVSATNWLTGANAQISGDTYTGGWYRTQGDTGWYSQKWGGGWYMSDSTWVRAYGNKNVYTSGTIQAGAMQANTVTSSGRLTTGEYISVGAATQGAGCSPNGLIASGPGGVILSCQGGAWSPQGGGSTVLTGYIGHGGQIPLPAGYAQSQCTWSAANATNFHGANAQYFSGEVAYADGSRIVTCGYYDQSTFKTPHVANGFVGAFCAYTISCQ